MRTVIIAGNWKMNTTPADAGELAREIARRTRIDGVVRILCPPFVCLDVVRAALASPEVASPAGSGVWVGAQNVHHALAGAYTGEIAAPMLVGLADWVIVGHSERRRDAGETDAQIAAKLANAWNAGIRPILCVGEVLADREAGQAEAVVQGQVRGALAGASIPSAATTSSGGPDGAAGLPWLTIAYEPVWAIGTGRNARGSDAAAMAAAIRRVLDDLGIESSTIPILYGGSVTSANIDEFLAEPAIDGALVGGASLKVDEMAGIVARAGLTAQARAAVRHGASDAPRP
ncbi:MAG: triose-phosphate isomerase [Chloroflexi bacterium]|nr:triose-phosphate isomerase [Chloroflexota bacterium]